VTSLLIKGNFPPVRRLFPEQTDHYAVVNTAELAEAVRRVALVLDRSAPLRFTFTEDGVSMDASGTEQRATESVDATLTGEDVTLGLNPQYLLEALGAVKSEFARITFTSSDNANKLSPVLITRRRRGRRRASSTCCSRTCCCADRLPPARAAPRSVGTAE
jgi:DNA polymerase-3 subunit beta